MFKKEEIDTLIQQDIDPQLKKKLNTVLDIRDYASTALHLPDNDSYRYYADIERPYVTWNVTAAPEFSLKPKTWCYFIIGCAVYRGYFDEQDADEEADKLKRQGWDVSISGATAYSTLGFFTDPVLNTMIHWRDYDIAGIIFHELSHQRLYIKNDTGFNEAFATSVQILGLISWMIEHQPEMLDRYLISLNRAEEFRKLKSTARAKLKALYEEQLPDEEKRQKKQQVFDEMRAEYQQLKDKWGVGDYDNWFTRPLNNARLISEAAYWQHVPAFLTLFFQSHKDWTKFYDRCEEISEMEKDKRLTFLTSLDTHNATLPNVLKALRDNTTI